MRQRSGPTRRRMVRTMSIESARQAAEADLMRLPNVVAVGIGEKAGREVITVFVERKVPEAQLGPDEMIPKAVQGYPVEVEEAGVVTSESEGE